MPTFIAAGGIAIDTITRAGETQPPRPGGAALYTAAAIHIWRPGEVGILGQIHQNYPQAWIARMQQAGIDTSGVIRRGKIGIETTILYDSNGNRRYAPANPLLEKVFTLIPGLLATIGLSIWRSTSIRASDIPPHYSSTRAARIGPVEFKRHAALVV